MKFAVTSKGFIKDRIVTIVDNRKNVEIIYTDKLRHAKQFNSKNKAIQFLENNGLEGFAYSPHEQEPIRDKFIVTRRTNHYIQHTNDIYEWIVEKASMLNKTDVVFLNNSFDDSKYFDYDDAVRICKERNLALLKELTDRINNETRF
jgi:hypothetical protein